MALTHAQLIEIVIRALPNGGQCRDFDMSEADALRFKWRGHHLQVSSTCFVEEVGDGVLIGSDLAILARSVLMPIYTQFL